MENEKYMILQKVNKMTENEKKVYNLLLTPIECSKEYSEIKISNGVIHTPQLYRRVADEDMSDFSIGFYKIIYKDLLKKNAGEMLQGNGAYVDAEYLGDTMHSFNSLANIILGDLSKDNRSPKDKWPPELLDYSKRYHCLANFWIIPMNHGRRSAKLSMYDSVDYYLYRVKNEFLDVGDGYYSNFPDWDSFLGMHCMSDYHIKNNSLDMYKIKDKDSCLKELDRISDAWVKRALELVEKFGDELYTYFSKELHLI